MNTRFALLVVLGLAFCAGRAQAASVNGQNYVSITNWAGANGYKTFWVKRNGELVATNRTTRLLFAVDSHYAEINGVQVALSYPIANQRGVALIAQFDLDTAVRPLLFPSRYIEPGKITTICLDPGHGGRDSGNHVQWRNEKTYTLALAEELRDQLKRAGFNVILTRSKDVYVDLPDRPALANEHGADLFVSLHFNATEAGSDSVKGIETYCITPVGASSSNAQGEGSNSRATVANRQEHRSLLLAYEVQKTLTRGLLTDDRGVRRARFAVLRDAKMPAILIEGGYMTHPAEGKKIFDEDYRKQMAEEIVKGIQAYQKITMPPAPKPVPSKSNVPSATVRTNLPSLTVRTNLATAVAVRTNGVSTVKRKE